MIFKNISGLLARRKDKMNEVGKVGSLISQSMYSVATRFHPFGGAVDVIVVEREDGSYRSTPWYVRFGKFQGVLKGTKKIIRISVNGVEASFHMNLDNSGEAYFLREVVSSKDNDKEAVVNESDTLEIIGEDNDNNNGDSVSLCRNEIDVSNADDVQFSDERGSLRTKIPTTEQIASLNLKDGQNMITFSFSTRVLGTQQVDAHVYLWKWNARIVISDVDGTITKSDARGQFMPLVGKDWTQTGVAQLFSAIRENGYQLLFLSARAIVQAYLTRRFLLSLKQDGKALPDGPIVISPDGLFSSLYREVIRRAAHEFKIACLEDIKALFPSDYNPFYAGFGNRATDKLSYGKIGIPEGKIFIINRKGEVAISHSIDLKTYMSLYTEVNDLFPPTSLVE